VRTVERDDAVIALDELQKLAKLQQRMAGRA
jgi:hypothetical protein